jgi:uncharacterized RDD family membrane protein YckC
MQVYLYVNEQQVGPYTIDQLQQLFEAAQIPGETPAWYEGLTEWITLASVLESVRESSSAANPSTPEITAEEFKPDPNCVRARFTVLFWDGSFFGIVTLPISILAVYIIKNIAPSFEGKPGFLIGWVTAAPFIAYFMSSQLQATPAMHWYRLIITDLEGRPISFSRAIVRHIVSLISYLLFFVGFIFAFFNKKHQTLHDMVAGTMVIRRPPNFAPSKSPWLPITAMLLPSILITIALLAFTKIGDSLADQDTANDASSQTNQQAAVVAPAPEQTQDKGQSSASAAASTPTVDNSTQNATAPEALQTNDDDFINEVKGGTLDFDNTVKIGHALEGSSFLKNVTWKSLQTAQGRQVVEATGLVNFEAYKNTNLDESGTKLPAEWVDAALKNAPSLKLTYTVQFQLSQADEKTISVGYSGYTMSGQNADTGQPSKAEIKDDDDLKILKSIFANQPDLQISSLLAGLSQQKPASPATLSAPASQAPQ